jgi:hypothetical protein
MELREDCCLIPAFGNNHDGKPFVMRVWKRKMMMTWDVSKFYSSLFILPFFSYFFQRKLSVCPLIYFPSHIVHTTTSNSSTRRGNLHTHHTHTHIKIAWSSSLTTLIYTVDNGVFSPSITPSELYSKSQENHHTSVEATNCNMSSFQTGHSHNFLDSRC